MDEVIAHASTVNILIYDTVNDSYILVDDQYIRKDVEITHEMKTLSYILVYTKVD